MDEREKVARGSDRSKARGGDNIGEEMCCLCLSTSPFICPPYLSLLRATIPYLSHHNTSSRTLYYINVIYYSKVIKRV
jgi:hypothetical protein